MSQQRESFLKQYLNSPRGQLDTLIRQNRQYASALPGGSMLCDLTAGVYEKCQKMKTWAEQIERDAGKYPEEIVNHFVASLKTS